jgi:nucleotide-binding universal stress UspA family protein
MTPSALPSAAAPAAYQSIVVGADLTVLGTRGKTNLRDMLLGSAAERVLAESRCSVLAVKP